MKNPGREQDKPSSPSSSRCCCTTQLITSYYAPDGAKSLESNPNPFDNGTSSRPTSCAIDRERRFRTRWARTAPRHLAAPITSWRKSEIIHPSRNRYGFVEALKDGDFGWFTHWHFAQGTWKGVATSKLPRHQRECNSSPAW